MPIRSIILVVLLLLAGGKYSLGQVDTLQPRTYFSNKLPARGEDTTFTYKIKNAAFPFLLGQKCEFPFDLLFYKEFQHAYNSNQNTFVLDQSLQVANCSQYRPNVKNMFWDRKAEIRYRINGNVELDHISSVPPIKGESILSSSPEVPFTISNLSDSQNVSLEFSHISGLWFEDCETNFRILGDTLEKGMAFHASRPTKMGSLDIESNSFMGEDANISILGPITFNGGILIDRNSFRRNYDISLFDDTINQVLNIDWDVNLENIIGFNDSTLFELEFSGCYINAPILVLSKFAKRFSISFTDCRFGPNAFLNVPGDNLEFADCGKLPTTLNLSLSKFTDTCWIAFSSTDFSDLPFTYEPRFHLKFQKNASADIYGPVYENLLAKFKKESKSDSYQRLDIEYREYRAIQGTMLDRFLSWWDCTWWNYGYTKGRVFGWTIFFLVIFTGSNFLLWRKMQRLYAIGEDNRIVDRINRRRVFSNLGNRRKFVYSLIYTSYIFFSIKLDFSKLKLSNSSLGLIIFFFFQYLGGLICLYFILNYLLKGG